MEFQIGLIEITVNTRISASSKLLQVPFSCSKYRSLAYILLCKYLLFKFALPFSLPRTYTRLVQPYRGFLWLSRYSETFLRTFITHMHVQSLPRPRDAATFAKNWSLTERRFCHLWRTVLGRYLLSCYTVKGVADYLSEVSQFSKAEWWIYFVLWLGLWAFWPWPWTSNQIQYKGALLSPWINLNTSMDK